MQQNNFDRLLDVAEQLVENINFETREVESLAAAQILRNAVRYYRDDENCAYDYFVSFTYCPIIGGERRYSSITFTRFGKICNADDIFDIIRRLKSAVGGAEDMTLLNYRLLGEHFVDDAGGV